MRIAIGAPFQYSYFSNGIGQTIIALADVLKLHGYDVTLIGTNGTTDWWDDVKMLKEKYKIVLYDNIDTTYDLFIDIDGNMQTDKRAKISSKCAMLWRKPPILFDIEPTIYPLNQGKRNFAGLTAIWTWDHFEQSDIDYITLLSGLPVVRLPYIWSPSALDAHRQETKFPEWSQTLDLMKDVNSWDCHVCETNFSCSSSSTLPMLIISHAKKHTTFPVSICNVHSADHIKTNEFFQKNVLEHCETEGLTYQFIGRQRCVDWTVHCKGWVISHIRFLPIKSYLIDLAWSGVPLVHNSIWLRDIHPALAELYYPDNSLTKGAEAMNKMIVNFDKKAGFFAPNALVEIRSAIIKWITPRFGSGSWKLAVDTAIKGEIFVEAKPVQEVKVEIVKPVIDIAEKKIKVCFTDMWADFNPSYNFFTLLLKEAVKNIKPAITIEGCDKSSLNGEKPNLVVFGPFGDEWKTFDGVPKVHFTGENTSPIDRDDVKLNLTYENTVNNDEKKIRLPLWMLEIDWFGADLEKIVNPKPLPLDVCCKADTDMIAKKDKFCAFVVTNPKNTVRNEAFAWLSLYKKIDSAGRLFNNMGDVIFAGLGGGGGELKKHEFLKNYKFCFAYENSSSSGYTTEKILHAKAAGCIPIYWGDPEVGRDFDVKGFINAQNAKSPEELIALVKSVDENPEKYAAMSALPALDSYRRDLVRRRLSEIAKRMLEFATGKNYTGEIPRFLGATTTAEAAGLQKARREEAELSLKKKQEIKFVPATDSVLDSVVVATFASKNYWESLCQWLDTYRQHSAAVKNIRAHVFLHSDIAAVSIEYLKEKFPFAVFEWVPTDCPPGFPDMWEPQHFAWKIWCYKKLANQPEYKDSIVWYTDCASVQVRWNLDYFKLALEYGVCVVEDPTQKNDQWCNEKSRQIMNITKEELADNQILGGLMALKSGSPEAIAFYNEAWKYAQIRDCIVGEKWAGLLPDGRPHGHRHDQSIMAVLSKRHGFPRYPLDRIYCDKSVRKTFKSGASVYVHRGNFAMHHPLTDRISEAHVINLDRRADRYEKFLKNHDGWAHGVERFSACEGRDLKLTPALARLLAPNDFMWKKAISGCAMSHLKLWHDLANEQPHIENYLILEDDVRFEKDWFTNVWQNAVELIPADYDVLYLGGVLPPNRPVFYGQLETVNKCWARVQPNQIFGQKEPTRYFHFCNYAYILKREAAIKLIKNIGDVGGYTTSADHMICNKVDMFKHYVLTPQVAGCYQDDDPKYQSSEFNNFNRVDGFDSDLWNNDERFTPEEVMKAVDLQMPVDIGAVLKDVFPVKNVEVVKPAKKVLTRTLKVIKGREPNAAGVLERKWLSSLFGSHLEIKYEALEEDHEPLDGCPIFFVQRPHTMLYQVLFMKYNKAKKPFLVLHLSDEFLDDIIDFYSLEFCKGVIRTYPRADIPDAVKAKVITIPLGYNKHSEGRIDMPWTETPSLPFRELTWSFYGTAWKNRMDLLKPLDSIGSNRSKFFESWMDAKQLSEMEYISETLNSIFVPCPPGMNPETFRLYEALEHGAIPIVVRSEGDELFIDMLKGNLQLLNIPTWEHAAFLMKNLLNDKQMLEVYRNQLLTQWTAYKDKIKGQIAIMMTSCSS